MPPRITELHSYKRYNREDFVKDLQQAPWDIIEQFDCINDSVDIWQKLFTDVVNVYAPLRRMRVKGEVAGWISEELRGKTKLRDRYLSKFKKTNDNDCWNKYKKMKNQVNRSLKAEKSKYFEELINSSQNPNQFWQGIKRVVNGDNRLQSN